MPVVAVPDPESGVSDGITIIRTDHAGTPLESPHHHRDGPASIRRIEAAEHPRWIWARTTEIYPALLNAGVRVRRCHDLGLTHAILSMRGGVPVPPQKLPDDDRPALFDSAPAQDPEQVAVAFAEQRRTIGNDARLDLLVAAESAGALAAAEMSFDGLPFSARAHHDFLESSLGPRPIGGDLPQRIQEVSAEISAAFGRRVNPASHIEVIDAFRREGIDLTSTRKHLLRQVDHPAVPLLLHHRDLSKLYGTNGWHWLENWVHDNRFRPVYVPGGVVSGRWASRGGGALQIPKALRSSVIADPGHTLVIADAGQLEPRILAAMSGDPRMVAAAGSDDLYAPVATEAFNGDRAKAKVAILGVLYGATAGEARALLAMLRRRFPIAVDFVERAARAGERGQIVHSWLGRACPPPSSDFWSHGDARARGRFTRNFVVQATASEWALCVLADLRRRLAEDPNSELVFFQHDEVMVHTRDPEGASRQVLAAVDVATHLLFGDTQVRFPMDVAVRECYAEDPEVS